MPNQLVQCTATALVLRSLPTVREDTDTGRRIFKGQVAEVWGLYSEEDLDWRYLEAPSGRGWASSKFLSQYSPSGIVVSPSPAWPKIPNGYEEIVRVFGPPGRPICSAGRAQLPEELRLGWSPATKVQEFACHKLMEDVFTSVYKTIYQQDLWDEIDTFDGCFNPRMVTGSQKISTHAWGISIDQNAKLLPRGTHKQQHFRIIKIFEDHGFYWGHNWNNPDPMHAQYARGY